MITGYSRGHEAAIERATETLVQIASSFGKDSPLVAEAEALLANIQAAADALK